MYLSRLLPMFLLCCLVANVARAQSIPDNLSCRADAIYSCKKTNCAANFNNNDLSLNFKAGKGAFCFAVFCTADGKVAFTDVKGGLSDKSHRLFSLVATRTTNGKRASFLFQGIVDADGKRFHMIGKDREMYFGECSSQ